jgi:diguanylate cyclase (GGDEF)-like protein
MVNKTTSQSFIETNISPAEELEIQKKVKFDIVSKIYQLTKIGSSLNFLIGIFIVWACYGQVKQLYLFGWLVGLFLVDAFSVLACYYYQYCNPTPQKIEPWRRLYFLVFALLGLAWGSINVLFITDNLQLQFFLSFILFIFIFSFPLGTITDYVASIISISCLLLPYLGSRAFASLNLIHTADIYSGLNLNFGIPILILGIFLMLVSYFGSQLLQKSFKLGYINAALSEKLAAANKDLEQANHSLDQKVKDRTLELENTLNLVTHQATHDLLTDLPNQRLLEQYLNEAITKAKATRGVFAVAFFGLNRTKIISDSLGHQTGSLIIKAVAERLKTLQDQSNNNASHTRYTITHAWGDVFVVVLSPLNIEDTASIVRRLFSVLQEPFYLNDKSFSLTASIGVCLYPKDGTDTKTLLMNAEAAMFRAKKYGGNKFEFYTAELNAHTTKQLELESGLYNALTQGQFTLHYQPIIDVKTGEIVGMEALTRWQHPTLGLVSPADFIPIAEDIGLIIPLGEWALRKACEQTKQWHDSGFATLRIAVNLAAKQLALETIIGTITNVLKETNLPADALELEFTETAILDEKIIPIARKLKELGIHLAIDDFGTGYSGLTYVRQFSIDKLKIDKSFVQDIGVNKESETIILTIIEMAKKLGMLTLAEGVENERQFLFLREHGCDLVQGYYFSRPVDAETFTSLLYKKDSVQSDRFKYLN